MPFPVNEYRLLEDLYASELQKKGYYDKFPTSNKQPGYIPNTSPIDVLTPLRQALQYNPKATNWLLDIGPETSPQTIGALTNLPNTLTVVGHGEGAGSPGFTSDSRINNALVDALELRDKGVAYGRKLALSELAAALNGKTNEVKRAVILSCYRGGYTPQEIKSAFPNVEEIIMGKEDMPTSTTRANDLLLRSPTSKQVSTNESSPLYNYSGGSTNLIRSYKDWNFPSHMTNYLLEPQF